MTHIIASSRPRALLLGLLLTATVGCGDSSGGDTGESGATTENPGSSTAETGDTADATGTSADTPTTDDATSTTDDATSTTASTGEPTTGEPAGGPEIVVEFDPLIFQLPEGLDVRDGAAYVGIVSGYVLKIDLATKTVMPFGGFMGLPQDNTAIMTGLVVGPQGEVYLALDVFAPGDFTSGVYKIPAGGGDAVQDPFGPPAPRLAPRDRAVGAAEAGPAPALKAPPWPRGHVRMDMLVRTCPRKHARTHMSREPCPSWARCSSPRRAPARSTCPRAP